MNPRTHWIGGSYEAACYGKLPKPPLDVRILQTINKQPGVTTSELVALLKASHSTTAHTLTRMQDKGLIHSNKVKVAVRIGAVYHQHWFNGPKVEDKPNAKKQPRSNQGVSARP